MIAAALIFMAATGANAQTPLPSLHVEGRNLVDTHGNPVVLHGVMDTPSPYFNNGRWGNSADTTKASMNACIGYFDKLFTAITDSAQGAYATVFRLHLDPAWTNDPTKPVTGRGTGEANISQFSIERLRFFLKNLYFPLMKHAIDHGLYVVVRPPGVCPDSVWVGGEYQQYLKTVWGTVASSDSVRKYEGQVSIELANEPVNVVDSENQSTGTALRDFFQPVIDTIRSCGFSGVVWVPGRAYQSNYESYKANPPSDSNYGYAVHAYVGWYNQPDSTADSASFVDEWARSIPVVESRPLIVTEVDWSPEVPGAGHTDEHGNYVPANLGTWATGTTSHWGKAFKGVLDHYGNISMTLSGTACYLDIDKYLADGTVTPAFNSNAEACGAACFEWYKAYHAKDYPRPDFTFKPTGDNGDGTYTNPVITADFPDVDVVRVGNLYYMATTTMHLFPGCTILKSSDLVNWQYCANPLKQVAATADYNLEDGKEAYAGGMWACSMKYHNGKFYVLINAMGVGGFLLTAMDPEGEWTVRSLSRAYYDPGMLFDGGKVYVACGTGGINICELDTAFNFVQEKSVLANKPGLEGSHLYKIGDYYYIYATYGGWPSGQVAFRSKDIFGPYEEKMLIEKEINGSVNTVHQGALVQTQKGDWWTMLFEDDGAIGRRPNLQPVTWEDNWPVIGAEGVPYKTYKKPDLGAALTTQPLPTNDNFRTYPLGSQWQWNHNPDNGAWSLFERPGFLRLRTASVARDFMHARNTLTQRVFTTRDDAALSTGTIRLDVRGMVVGDRAGIALQQDPYALIGVERTVEGYNLVWRQDTLDFVDDFTPDSLAQPIALDSVIYLRAQYQNSTSRATFAFSTDNSTYTSFGRATEMRYNLAVFVGVRFAIFNYATRAVGGYADVDWFSTEPRFEENTYYDPTFSAMSREMLTMTNLQFPDTLELMTGNSVTLPLIADFEDGHSENVGAQARISLSADSILSVRSGMIQALRQGSLTLSASFTDPMGNTLAVQSHVISTFFPFDSTQISMSLFGDNNRYDQSTRTFTPGQYGQLGWRYVNGANMSGYKFLVFLFDSEPPGGAAVNIFQTDNIWGDCYNQPFSGLRAVVPLTAATLTSGDGKGKLLDPSSIYIISFWSYGNGDIDIADVYLTNNSDYSPPTGITSPWVSGSGSSDGSGGGSPDGALSRYCGVYSISGELIRRGTSTAGLPPGIYIVGNRKIVIR